VLGKICLKLKESGHRKVGNQVRIEYFPEKYPQKKETAGKLLARLLPCQRRLSASEDTNGKTACRHGSEAMAGSAYWPAIAG